MNIWVLLIKTESYGDWPVVFDKKYSKKKIEQFIKQEYPCVFGSGEWKTEWHQVREISRCA
jgi:hypothetical protein